MLLLPWLVPYNGIREIGNLSMVPGTATYTYSSSTFLINHCCYFMCCMDSWIGTLIKGERGCFLIKPTEGFEDFFLRLHGQCLHIRGTRVNQKVLIAFVYTHTFPALLLFKFSMMILASLSTLKFERL